MVTHLCTRLRSSYQCRSPYSPPATKRPSPPLLLNVTVLFAAQTALPSSAHLKTRLASQFRSQAATCVHQSQQWDARACERTGITGP
ncbi:hypothetical protein BDY19DRAFT_976901 [Irpex rosettiformis]|uniref:Uncharacterized protein n=1 Tax=Irpex rosettiformis TaxID=378272 RepID=A0ACB8TNI4_9APHY|nr:hypothetical protein BDY19DRAFT_976901 [Irpex rosettiformis]